MSHANSPGETYFRWYYDNNVWKDMQIGRAHV